MNKQYIEYLPNYAVPNHLIELCINKIETQPNEFSKGKWENWNKEFCTYSMPLELIEWIKNLYKIVEFSSIDCFRIQTLNSNIPIHKDRKRNRALNYIIDPGGEKVFTAWYSTDNSLLYSESIKQNQWHIIDTQTRHGVHGILDDKLRIMLSIDLFD